MGHGHLLIAEVWMDQRLGPSSPLLHDLGLVVDQGRSQEVDGGHHPDQEHKYARGSTNNTLRRLHLV